MLLSWIVGKPSIAWEYQFGKTYDCLESIGMDRFVIKTTDYNFDEYKRKFEYLCENREEIIIESQNNINKFKDKQKKI